MAGEQLLGTAAMGGAAPAVPARLAAPAPHALASPAVGSEDSPPGSHQKKLYNLFISHTKRSKLYPVEYFINLTIKEPLAQHGLNYFFDKNDLAGREIEYCLQAVEESQVLLALLDDHFPTSWCKRELEVAIRCGIPIIPVYNETIFNVDLLKSRWPADHLREAVWRIGAVGISSSQDCTRHATVEQLLSIVRKHASPLNRAVQAQHNRSRITENAENLPLMSHVEVASHLEDSTLPTQEFQFSKTVMKDVAPARGAHMAKRLLAALPAEMRQLPVGRDIQFCIDNPSAWKGKARRDSIMKDGRLHWAFWSTESTTDGRSCSFAFLHAVAPETEVSEVRTVAKMIQLGHIAAIEESGELKLKLIAS